MMSATSTKVSSPPVLEHLAHVVSSEQQLLREEGVPFSSEVGAEMLLTKRDEANKEESYEKCCPVQVLENNSADALAQQVSEGSDPRRDEDEGMNAPQSDVTHPRSGVVPPQKIFEQKILFRASSCTAATPPMEQTTPNFERPRTTDDIVLTDPNNVLAASSGRRTSGRAPSWSSRTPKAAAMNLAGPGVDARFVGSLSTPRAPPSCAGKKVVELLNQEMKKKKDTKEDEEDHVHDKSPREVLAVEHSSTVAADQAAGGGGAAAMRQLAFGPPQTGGRGPGTEAALFSPRTGRAGCMIMMNNYNTQVVDEEQLMMTPTSTLHGQEQHLQDSTLQHYSFPNLQPSLSLSRDCSAETMTMQWTTTNGGALLAGGGRGPHQQPQQKEHHRRHYSLIKCKSVWVWKNARFVMHISHDP